jgi:hypothetical protein
MPLQLIVHPPLLVKTLHVLGCSYVVLLLLLQTLLHCCQAAYYDRKHQLHLSPASVL